MGKPKAKPKRHIEENEFLKSIIDEVKSLENSDSVISDDSPEAEANNVLIPNLEHEEDEPGGFIVNDGAGSPVEDLPTMFAQMKSDAKAPSLAANEKTIASVDSMPFSPADSTSTAAATSTAATVATSQESDRTVAVEGARRGRPVLQEKVVTGALKGTRNGQVYTSLDASLAQAETLKIAQSRIKELEVEIDRLRQENDDLSSAGDVVTRRVEEYQIRVQRLEKEKSDLAEQSKSELLILKGNLQFKDTELSKTKAKLEDLEMRIKTDFRKIRVRERELENRLELVRGEKQALMRAKDEKILDLQRKLDQYKTELDLYRAKVQDLNKLMESQHDQMQKTIRALRIALVNLEHDESSTGSSSEPSEGQDDDYKKAK
jgi:hypothetical protein